MPDARAEANEERVLVWAPTGKDGLLARDLLARLRISATRCDDKESFCAAVRAGVGVAIVADEALAGPSALESVVSVLTEQPAWSDVPIVIFTRDGHAVDRVLSILGPLANVTTLERPVRVTTLASLVQTGLRARRRQYQVRALLRSLAEADRRKDEFLAMLGHELRNPLSAIRMALAVVDRWGLDDARLSRQLGVIDRQTNNLSHLVEDLLDVTRITRGKITLRREVVDLNEIVRRAQQTCQASVQARRQTLDVVPSAEPVLVDGDPVRLEQVVSNLLHNASKYSRDEGRTRVTVACEDGLGVVSVVDDGIGIHADNLAKIFEVFTQLDVTLDRAQGGLGLGLALVRGLVELHGGTVVAESDGPGQGARFTVRLPAVRTGAPAAEREVPPLELPPSGTKILVVDDNEDLREGIRELLEGWGHTVRVAADGVQAVASVKADPPHIALIDIGLPLLDGYEVARRIRGLETRIRLLAMSGYGQLADREKALEAGFDRHLVKPVRAEELLAEVSALVPAP